jgi:hypothetical protein
MSGRGEREAGAGLCNAHAPCRSRTHPLSAHRTTHYALALPNARAHIARLASVMPKKIEEDGETGANVAVRENHAKMVSVVLRSRTSCRRRIA